MVDEIDINQMLKLYRIKLLVDGGNCTLNNKKGKDRETSPRR